MSSVLCCGIIYDKKNINTYWCIETYKLIKPYISNVKMQKVIMENCEVFVCKKCGSTKVLVNRYGKNKRLLEHKRLKGIEAIDYLTATSELRILQPRKIPCKNIPYSKTLPFVYGKVTGKNTQRPRYINESGWSGDSIDAKLTVSEL